MMRVAILFAGIAIAWPAHSADIVGRASVIDGDTIEIGGTRIRFDGVDAPERRQTCLDADGAKYRCGHQSAFALDDFLAASRPTTCTPKGKSWDRMVASCWRADGEDVSAWMVRNGHAIDWPKYSKGRYAGATRGGGFRYWRPGGRIRASLRDPQGLVRLRVAHRRESPPVSHPLGTFPH